MNCELTINDFNPSDTFKSIFKKNIEALLEVAPSDSGASSNISKTLTGYLGVLQIISSQKKFIVSTDGRDLDELIKSLFALMHKQITIWRNQRFLGEPKEK